MNIEKLLTENSTAIASLLGFIGLFICITVNSIYNEIKSTIRAKIKADAEVEGAKEKRKGIEALADKVEVKLSSTDIANIFGSKEE